MQNGISQVEVIIETPRWSFLKRGSNGKVDFISPLPCPFNYGSIPAYTGMEGDLLDAVVLGSRLPQGSIVQVYAWGAVGMTDRGLYDDKIICSREPVPRWKQHFVVLFFMIYAKAKIIINLIRGKTGYNKCKGWGDVAEALARATPGA